MTTHKLTVDSGFARLRAWWWLSVAILLAGVFAVAIPKTSYAAGETFSWQGNNIAGSGGVFATKDFSPNNVTFTKNGDVYKTEQRWNIGGNQATFCFVDYTITLTSGSSGSMQVKFRDCPGQGNGTTIPNIAITGTPPAGSPGGPAPTTGGITGVALLQSATDSTKLIYIKNFPIQLEGTGYSAVVSTDNNGNFVFTQVPPGTYTVRASGPYSDPTVGNLQINASTANVVVAAGQTTEVSLRQVVSINPSASTDTCASQTKGVGWIACPLITTAADAAQKLADFVVSLLKLDTATLFTTPDTSQAYHTVWAGFRNIAYAILVIIGLIMVASQVFNIELLSAYTLRKMLPGLIVAIIFVTLSWDIMEFLYNLSNDAADAVMDIIRGPFQQVGALRDLLADGRPQDSIGHAILGILRSLGLVAGAGAALFIYGAFGGWGVILSLVLSLGLAILSIFILLAARNVVAYLLVIIAPIAIICAAFDPFKKVFSFWRGLVVVIIITVPGVAAILAMTGMASLVAAAAGGALNVFTAFIILVAGFALVWTLFLQMDKITGFLGNVASKATGKAQKALSDYRGNTLKNRFKQAATGERNVFGEKFGWQRGLSEFAGRQARRTLLAGQPGAAAFGEKFKAAEQNLLQQTALKKQADEGGRWTGDDDLMGVLGDTEGEGRSYSSALAAYSKVTEKRAIDSATQAKGAPLTAAETASARTRGHQEAVRGLNGAVASLGAPIGSKLMSSTAYKAKVGSVSAYNGEEFDKLETEEGVKRMYQQLMQDIVPKVADGTMSVTDATNAIKKNTQRMDLAGHSFPQIMSQIAVSAERYRQGARGADLITDDEIEKWRNGSIQYSQAGAQIAGRTETVKVQAQQEYKQLQKAQENVQIARQNLDPAVVARANDAAEVFAQAQEAFGRARTEPERARAQDMLDATRQQAIQAQQALESQPEYAKVKEAEDTMDRYLASFSVKHDQMGYASKENREWYEKLLLGKSLPGEEGTPIMTKIEQRRSSPTFQRLHKEFTQSYAASTQSYIAQQALQQQQAAAAQGGIPQAGQMPQFGGSDRWLKYDIQQVGTALDGTVNLYRFKYLGDDQDYVGVMAQELLTSHPDAVLKAPDGFYRVNYAKLGVPFLTYQEWKKRSAGRVKSL